MAVPYTSTTWIVKKGHEQEFVRRWNEFAQWSSAQGLRASAMLLRDVDEPTHFVSFGPWESLQVIDGAATITYDATVVNTNRYDFGGQALQVSNATTSGSFDMPVSPRLAEPAGQTQLRKHFEASFDIGTSSDTVTPGLEISVSPDSGDGGRQSYLRFKDEADKVHVFVTDASFVQKEIATLDRASAHKVRFSLTFKNRADDVKIFIDNKKVWSGTTWEDFYAAGDNPSVSALLFRLGGSIPQVESTMGKGFLIDNMTLASS